MVNIKCRSCGQIFGVEDETYELCIKGGISMNEINLCDDCENDPADEYDEQEPINI